MLVFIYCMNYTVGYIVLYQCVGIIEYNYYMHRLIYVYVYGLTHMSCTMATGDHIPTYICVYK